MYAIHPPTEEATAVKPWGSTRHLFLVSAKIVPFCSFRKMKDKPLGNQQVRKFIA